MTIKKLLILILIAVPVYFLHQHRPTYADHAAKVYEVYSGEVLPVGEELPPWPQWQKLEYRDFYIITASQDFDKKTLVSFGWVGYIKVLDEDWAKEAFKNAGNQNN